MNPVLRRAYFGSAFVVAAIAAIASYSHMRHLALEYKQPEVIADMLPISVDGMLVVATLALGDGRRNRWSAWAAATIGVAASIVANVLAAEPSVIARCISAWPAIAFLFVVEVITRGGRSRATKPVEVVEEPAVDDASDDASPEPPHPTAVKIAAIRKRYPRITQQRAAERLEIALRTVQRHWPDASSDVPPTPTVEPVNGKVPDFEDVSL